MVAHLLWEQGVVGSNPASPTTAASATIHHRTALGADVHELEYLDNVHGVVVATFDGTVLEVFTDRVGSTTRLHRRLLHLAVDGPDRKGRHEVKLTTQPDGRGGGTTLFVPPEAWPQVEPFVVAVASAVAP